MSGIPIIFVSLKRIQKKAGATEVTQAYVFGQSRC